MAKDSPPKNHWPVTVVVSFSGTFFYSQNGDHPYEDLAKYGDEPDIK